MDIYYADSNTVIVHEINIDLIISRFSMLSQYSMHSKNYSRLKLLTIQKSITCRKVIPNEHVNIFRLYQVQTSMERFCQL